MPGPEGKTVTVSIRVSPEMRDELKRVAKAQRRTVSQIVMFMVEEGLAALRAGDKR
jgi:predicted DNA-binding protein